MKCPHCKIEFHPTELVFPLGARSNGINPRNGAVEYLQWTVHVYECPACFHSTINLTGKQFAKRVREGEGGFRKVIHAHPATAARGPAPEGVPDNLALDYNEACLTQHVSPRASAALSRRCLLHLLLEGRLSSRLDLAGAIQDAVARLPDDIGESLAAVAQIGQFSAQPAKASHMAGIFDATQQEAEWNLNVIELLFDHLYLQPARKMAIRQQLENFRHQASHAAGGKPGGGWQSGQFVNGLHASRKD